MISVDAQKIELFKSLFRGRSDVYARRWEKEGHSGYSPAYEFNWDEFMAHKRRGGSIKDFENKKILPLTDEVIKKHLLGLHVVGVYPILPDNSSYFLAADFDGETWKKEAELFINACRIYGLVAYLERSRSGNGGHVWIFFSEPYSCRKSRQLGLELIRHAYNISEFEKEISFDRLFPNQDSISKGGYGNLIALPFQGKSVLQGNTVFIDLETGCPFPDQWIYLRELRRYSRKETDDVYQKIFKEKENLSIPVETAEHSLTISVSNKIVLVYTELTPPLRDFLKEELNFLNSEYFVKRQLGKSTYKVQKYYKLIEESGEYVLLPRGFLNKLIDFLNSHEINHTVNHEYSTINELSYESLIQLSPSQATVVNSAMANDQGVIVAPSGSGKTIIGLELIARRKLPALILVHRKQILDQWMERIQTFLGIPKTQIGQYCGAKKTFGKHITVALLQSLSRKTDLSQLNNQFGIIVIDECHHIPATTFREVVTQFNPHYLYGLTATPIRKHNDEKLIYVYIGDIIAQMKTADITSVSSVVSVPPEVFVRTTNLVIPFKFKTDLFQLLSKVICFDSSRNQLIVQDILEQTTGGNKVLILSERKEHLEILNLYLKGKCETIVISGDDSVRARKSKMRQITDGHFQAILSTGQFFGEGLDIRGITCLVLAFPFSFEGKLIQYMGRLREIEKPKLIIDYRDNKIPFLEKQFKQREKYYKKNLL